MYIYTKKSQYMLQLWLRKLYAIFRAPFEHVWHMETRRNSNNSIAESWDMTFVLNAMRNICMHLWNMNRIPYTMLYRRKRKAVLSSACFLFYYFYYFYFFKLNGNVILSMFRLHFHSIHTFFVIQQILWGR